MWSSCHRIRSRWSGTDAETFALCLLPRNPYIPLGRLSKYTWEHVLSQAICLRIMRSSYLLSFDTHNWHCRASGTSSLSKAGNPVFRQLAYLILTTAGEQSQPRRTFGQSARANSPYAIKWCRVGDKISILDIPSLRLFQRSTIDSHGR
jgi:hypothetical protein